MYHASLPPSHYLSHHCLSHVWGRWHHFTESQALIFPTIRSKIYLALPLPGSGAALSDP